MRAIRLDHLSGEHRDELDKLYHTTHDVRVRTRALMILLAAERRLVASEVAAIVRQDAPRSGKPPKVTSRYRERLLELVRRRPRALDLPFSMWTAARLADRLAEETGLRLSVPSIHRPLREAGMALSRPQHMITSPDPDYALKKRRSKRLAIS